jgi:ATP-dependent exoDNAse (exonuclease V) alpha subunit
VVKGGNNFTVLYNAGLSGSTRRYAENYTIGQEIFIQKGTKGFEKGQTGRIIAVDTQKNTIDIELNDKKSSVKRVKTIELNHSAGCIQAYNVDQRSFGKGDSIITLKNDRKLKLENGKIGIIKNISDNGDVEVLFNRKIVEKKLSVIDVDVKNSEMYALPTVDMGVLKKNREYQIRAIDKKQGTVTVEYEVEGKKKLTTLDKNDVEKLLYYRYAGVKFNIKSYQYCDHAYCVTSFKSQGCTIDTVKIVHDKAHKTNYNEVYVAVTRARNNATVYTNDYNQLVERAKNEQEKLSVLDFKNCRQSEIESEVTIEEKIFERRKQPQHEIEVQKSVIIDKTNKPHIDISL